MESEHDSDEESLLGLHVIGAGVGESIIIQIPHESQRGQFHWGVIDCYSSSRDPSANRTLRFLLSKRELGACNLDFACVTHPHEDHFFGLWHLFASTDIKIDKFWRFQADDPTLWRVFSSLSRGSSASGQDSDYTRLEEELDYLLKYTEPHRKSRDPAKYRRLSGYNRSIYKRQLATIRSGLPVPLSIALLAPSGRQFDGHTRALAACITEGDSPEDWHFDKARYDRRIHNLLSVVLLMTFGDARIVLGADAEADSWRDIFDDSDRKGDGVGLACNLIKVSHHGSETAFVETAWTEHRSMAAPIAVITPYARGRTSLPQEAMIQRFEGLASDVHVTSRAIRRVTGIPKYKSRVVRRGARLVVTQGMESLGRTLRIDHLGNVVSVEPLRLE
jgi:hypothetical protein